MKSFDFKVCLFIFSFLFFPHAIIASNSTESVLYRNDFDHNTYQHKTYVSLSTSPLRVNKILPVLQSIDLDSIDEILLILPKKYRNREEYPSLSSEITSFPKLKILRPEIDYGPISKLVPAAEYVTDPESIIITIDDDTVYKRETFSELMQVAIMRDAVAGASGTNLNFWNINKEDGTWPIDEKASTCRSSELSYCHILEGFAAVAYKQKHISVERMKELSKVSSACKTSDDLVISFCLALDKVGRVGVRSDRVGNHQLEYGFGSDALHKGSGYIASETDCNALRYQKCYEDLRKWKQNYIQNSKTLSIPNGSVPVAENVTVVLTSLPSRIFGIHHTLESILQGSLLPKEIVVVIPFHSIKEERAYDLPSFLENHPFIRVLRSEDWGPNTKFIPLIQEKKARGLEKDGILVIDDDQIYPKDMLKNFMNWHEKYPDFVLANRGHEMPETLKFEDAGIIHSYEVSELTPVSIITGVGGYLVQARFFDESLWTDLPFPEKNKPQIDSAAFFVDDAWISAHLAKNAVKSFVVPSQSCWSFVEEQAINRIGGGGRFNDAVFNDYKDYWTVFGNKDTIPQCLPGNQRRSPCMACRDSEGNIF